VHALGHWINGTLRAPVDLTAPVDVTAPSHADALHALRDDIAGRRVHTLLVIGANPAYDTPGELGLGEAIRSVPFTASLGLYADETADACTWQLPLAHPLESWSDLRSLDGTASIVQPLIRPLYDTRTAHDLIAYLAGAAAPSSYDLVRQTWQAHAQGGTDFETWWRGIVHDGVVPDTAEKPVSLPAAKMPSVAPAPQPVGLTLALAADPSLFDGSFANNAWLQECPRPLTSQVWGNAAHLSPGDAERLRLTDGDVVRLGHGQMTVEAPVLVQAGQADGVIAMTLGHGRTRAGAIGNQVGTDAYGLRSSSSPWVIENIALTVAHRRQELLRTQHHHALEGEAQELLPILSLADLARGEHPPQTADDRLPSLLPSHQYDGYAWSMVIDTAACIGCNACVVACQAENNVPVVGADEISMGRDMHWLRIDSYIRAEPALPGFQPVPCMHCEHAPCEPVCPVMASVHDSEGLNVQVYNRCVGTRFCQSNCPYKVRRFNFFGYADGQEYANLGAETVKLQFNPNVTVRARGVMEKCTYCVQRISGARRSAEKEDRRIADGEVTTACQDACPTRAISFGDRNDAAAQVNALRGDARHYELLGHLGTRPRTTYLARLRNPNPALLEAGS
jgi:molybdopterin-containing oxidoreductase family iron-sulfur binding subunit